MNNRICFFSQMYQAIPSLVAVQRELGGQFVCGRSSTTRYFKNEYPELGFARFRKRFKRFSEGYQAMSKADCIVTGSSYQSLLAPHSAKKMMVFHGTYAGLSPQALEDLRHFDHLFLIGERMERMLLRYQNGHEFNYTKTGFIPFSNFPDKNEKNKRLLLSTLGLDTSLKTVVYCPSRRGVGTWELCASQLIRDLSDEYNLIMRPHPSQSMNLRWHEKSSMKGLQLAAKNRGNTVVDLVDFSLPDVLMIADLLISDANSPSEEALYYDTPQLFTGLGNSSYETIQQALVGRDLLQEDVEDVLRIFNCGPVYALEDSAHWGEAVDNAFLSQDDYSDNRKASFNSIFGQRDQHAGLRVAEIIRNSFLCD
ncbi:MAG TPA: hypothetical protein EYQ52_01805 [Candidatus Thioglobus sp.]|nr:hypothetical protein [Candidatus Thioglobus sp.]